MQTYYKAQEHLVIEVIKQKAMDGDDIEEINIEKIKQEQIWIYNYESYIKIWNIDIERQNQENLKDIQKFQKLYDLKI